MLLYFYSQCSYFLMCCLFHVFTNYLMQIYLYSITTEFNLTRLKVDANVTTGRKVEHKMNGIKKHLVGSR